MRWWSQPRRSLGTSMLLLLNELKARAQAHSKVHRTSELCETASIQPPMFTRMTISCDSAECIRGDIIITELRLFGGFKWWREFYYLRVRFALDFIKWVWGKNCLPRDNLKMWRINFASKNKLLSCLHLRGPICSTNWIHFVFYVLITSRPTKSLTGVETSQ